MTQRLPSLALLAPVPGGLPDHVITALMEVSPTLASAFYAAYAAFAGVRFVSLVLLAHWF
jgi:hypothetical protein